MTEFQRAAACLPPVLRELLDKLPLSVQDRVQEIRLRAGAPVSLSAGNKDWLLTAGGDVTELARPSLFCCDQALLADCFQALCDYSVHTHQQEIRNGYISTRTGSRAGIAGSAVVEDGQIVSMRRITSICLRVARRHDGCADPLIPLLLEGGSLRSALLCGEPSSGKTSLLRDLARQLSSGKRGRRFRVAVVDERGELAGEAGLPGCDVLLYIPKGQGIQQAVRCLAPDVVVFDELGSAEEVAAVEAGLNAGTAVLASAHCRDLATLRSRPVITAALSTGAFERVVWLEGRGRPGRLGRVLSAEECLAVVPVRGGRLSG